MIALVIEESGSFSFFFGSEVDFVSERDITISPDGNELIYTLSDYARSIRSLVKIEKTRMDGETGRF